MKNRGIGEAPSVSPVRIMVLLISALFAIETLLMFLLPRILPNTANEYFDNFADAFFLSLLFLPILYRYLFLPFKQFAEAQKSIAENVLGNVIDGVVIFDDEHRIHAFNHASQTMFGYTPQEVVGQDLQVLLAEDFRQKLFSTGSALPGVLREYTGRRKDGSTVPLDLSISPIKIGDLWMHLAIMRDITSRKKAEETLRGTLSLLSATIESTADGILVRDLNGKSVVYNRRFVEMWGIPESVLSTGDERLMREHILDQLKDPAAFMELTNRNYLEPGLESKDVLAFLDGRFFERVSMPHVVENRIVGRVVSFRDVTEQKKLELQLRHSQKMEALGTLAGGVAHDFNNILTVIIGYCNIAANSLPKDSPLQKILDQIQGASERAASLTASLLAYGRKNPLEPKPLDLGQTVRQFAKFLKRVIGEDVELVTKLSEAPLAVLGDRGQIEQVLMNLAANARDAMSGKGSLVIDLHQIVMTPEFVRRHGFGAPGGYALLSVSDTGSGMEEGVREKVFEPFFTTKEVGQGTGLGLSIVYGIVKQHQGHINVYSEPGKGTTFTIYLPLTDQPVGGTRRDGGTTHVGNETVLLIEDDAAVRALVGNVLREAGYRVSEAVDGEDAVQRFREEQGMVDLLVLDVIMPKKNGREAYEEIAKIRPGVKAIFMSGYTADIVKRNGLMDDGLPLLNKPLSPSELLHKVRETLDAA